MGGQQSARRISIENDEPNNVIKVSEKVVERLKGSVEGGEKPNPPNPPRSTLSSTVHIRPRKVLSEADDDEEIGETSLELKRKFEEEIQQNNEYWEGRIKSLQESHERIHETWEKEYQRALEDVERIFPKFPAKDKLPCSDKKSVVLDCYKKNSAQPLLCASEVQAFSDCMNNIRVNSQD